MDSVKSDMAFLKKRIEELEKGTGVKAPVDLSEIENITITDLGKICATYGLTIRSLFNP